ncbi:hypothetical protein LINPERPRIM_LOCUS34217, partial [Linum perenne]
MDKMPDALIRRSREPYCLVMDSADSLMVLSTVRSKGKTVSRSAYLSFNSSNPVDPLGFRQVATTFPLSLLSRSC